MVKENTMKQTEIGILPEEWNVVNLNEISKISSSKRIFESDYVAYGIPFYRGKEISLLMQNKTIDEPFYISEAKYFSLANKYGYPKNGDLLITAVGTLGNIYCINNDEKFYFKDGNLIWINNIIQNSKFLKIALDYNKQQILDNAIGSSQKALTINSLSITKIPLPSLPEQEAIAEALSDADAWIESLEQLIAKKRLIKQGAMQELLSPKEDWEVKKLGEMTFITKLAGFEYSLHFNSYRDKGDIIVIRGTNITKNKLDLSDIKTIQSKTSNYLVRSKLFKNDLVFAYVGTIGPIYLVEENDRFHLGPNTAKITVNKDLNSKYLYHYFTSSFIKNEIKEHTSIGAQPSLSMSKIRSFTFNFPSLTEQTRIATILSDMDAELEALEGQLGKARKVKQGMMQKLLTGRIRLI